MKNTLLLSMGVIIILASCSQTSQQKKEETFKVISPFVTDTVYINEYIAEINALQNVEIRTRVNGFIETIFVDEGQTVHKGQILFSISSTEYQQELKKAKASTKNAIAELKSAQIELENSQKLLDKKIIGKPEYDLATEKVDALKAKVEEAELNVAQAELNLSFTQIRAPFDGIINRIPNKVGSLLEEGTLLTTISNNKEVYAYFNVSETDYLNYVATKDEGKSKEVSLILANGTVFKHTGVIETIESEFDKSTGTIAFRAKFPNPEQILKHGSTGKIQIKATLKNALLIPQKATFDRQEYLCVFVVGEGNTIQVQKITSLMRLPHLFVVGSGLSPEDKILYEGLQLVKEGDKIVPKMISFPQVINQ